ncbi:LysR family transcriptional regulator [Chania multitudinisentens RB-25]|uniref:LysR family transcriptional regulator n=1 Tax=Chania multitudinisentens RB-25 TaxID=1441930 RepID=A0A0D4ZYK1_9GAMM|nr:LysR substrate-binding domain-containing protein [Chania multitudinisentens]AJW28951.1 LysR family transcriptional regulator [Chania multitudinisentens RB-25]
MNIELRHLRYFVAVAEELHFGRAAERLRISQPPLSQQIKALEEMLGARLLARNNRNVGLTQAGEMFLKEAYQVLDQVNRAAEKATRLERGEIGELMIGFTSSAPFISAVSRSLRTFRQLSPNVHIKMREINTKQQLVPLLNGELDLGVMRNTRLPDALQHQVLLREPLLAVVPNGHPLVHKAPGTLRFTDLAQEPFVFFSREVGTALYDEILALLANAGIAPYITQEVGEAMTIIGLVAAGLGISILPTSFGRVKIDGVTYLPIAEPDAMTEVWLVYHCSRPLSAAARTLVALMLKPA